MRLFFGKDIIGNQKIFSVTVTATNATYTGDSVITVGGTASVTFSAGLGYMLPSTVTVTGATGSWNQSTGVLILSNPTANVAVTVEAVALYTVTVSAQNCTYTGDSYIAPSGTAGLVFTADTGYNLPQTVTVSGASYTWDDTTGVLLLSSPTGNVTVSVAAEAAPVSNKIFGVSGLYQSSPALTRTDDAQNMSATVNSSSGQVSSPFDSEFPWNEATVETIDGNKFVHMPDMWFRVGKDSSDRITDVAVSKAQGSTGDWYKVDSFYYGCYGGSVSGGKLRSVSGVARQASKTRANFRTYASANGSGYFQRDLYHNTVMLFLWWIEFANKDSQSIMRGRDALHGSSSLNTGGTNFLGEYGTEGAIPSGFNTTTGQMRWHYIEDFVGNYSEFVDGSVGSGTAGGVQYVTADPSKFSDSTTGFNTLSYNSPASVNSPCLSAIGWDDNNPFLVLPKEVIANIYAYDTYFCDSCSTTNNIVLYSGAVWSNSTADNGVTRFSRGGESVTESTISARLLYKPAS